MPLHVDFNNRMYPDTIFLRFARATLRHVHNLLRALVGIAGQHGFKPEVVLVIGLYEELRHTVSSMLDPADESRLKELDVELLARYVVKLEQFIEGMKAKGVPAMNARPARVQRFYRILFSMITEWWTRSHRGDRSANRHYTSPQSILYLTLECMVIPG